MVGYLSLLISAGHHDNRIFVCHETQSLWVSFSIIFYLGRRIHVWYMYILHLVDFWGSRRYVYIYIPYIHPTSIVLAKKTIKQTIFQMPCNPIEFSELSSWHLQWVWLPPNVHWDPLVDSHGPSCGLKSEKKTHIWLLIHKITQQRVRTCTIKCQ